MAEKLDAGKGGCVIVTWTVGGETYLNKRDTVHWLTNYLAMTDLHPETVKTLRELINNLENPV